MCSVVTMSASATSSYIRPSLAITTVVASLSIDPRSGSRERELERERILDRQAGRQAN